jgi:hypothetical protein
MKQPPPRQWEWSQRFTPVAAAVVVMAPTSLEEDTQAWCTTLFPEPHNELQIGVVDYLLHGGSERYEYRSLQSRNMEIIGPIVKEVLKDAGLPEDENALVESIADMVKVIHQKAYSVGIPDKPGSTQPHIQREVTKQKIRPVRSQQGMFGSRVAVIENPKNDPGGVKSSRLHALQFRDNEPHVGRWTG